MMETMQTPATRAEFEHNLHLLREQICRGKFHIPKGMALGIEKVRYLPNGRIDLLSINESTRLQANMMMQFQSNAFMNMVRNQEAKTGQMSSVIEDTGEVTQSKPE